MYMIHITIVRHILSTAFDGKPVDHVVKNGLWKNQTSRRRGYCGRVGSRAGEGIEPHAKIDRRGRHYRWTDDRWERV